MSVMDISQLSATQYIIYLLTNFTSIFPQPILLTCRIVTKQIQMVHMSYTTATVTWTARVHTINSIVLRIQIPQTNLVIKIQSLQCR